MARYPWHDSEHFNSLYERAIREIPKDRYAEYDFLVHSEWDRAAGRMEKRINRKSFEDHTQIALDYWFSLREARMIPGAENAVKLAEIRGFAPLFNAAKLAKEVDQKLKEALRLIGRD